MGLTLHAYGPSVYCQIVRMALAECGLSAAIAEVDPFTGTGSNPHPFGLVPVLDDGDCSLYETAAILRYLDQHYAGGRFTPEGAKAQARMVQAQGIVDSHAYWPLVRMVFVQFVHASTGDEEFDASQMKKGLMQAETVLDALEEIADEALVLTTETLTLADFHLAPMIGFFAAAPEGAEALARRPALAKWFAATRRLPSYRDTCPPLSREAD